MVSSAEFGNAGDAFKRLHHPIYPEKAFKSLGKRWIGKEIMAKKLFLLFKGDKRRE